MTSVSKCHETPALSPESHPWASLHAQSRNESMFMLHACLEQPWELFYPLNLLSLPCSWDLMLGQSWLILILITYESPPPTPALLAPTSFLMKQIYYQFLKCTYIYKVSICVTSFLIVHKWYHSIDTILHLKMLQTQTFTSQNLF